ncbi:hypothetical protein GLW08_02905 [Pontibacillus yanchengensis]|uniref:Uncharacterized protein n=2 Tax=Pontibacillus yanchengensis TaxID=462910 RepID=A0ACC7VBJ9_9BACI|nr:hypothetical protein [Pontibacillus yanchengensis]MYL34731.1 hypothetical protein [Pontibacillus yanchengensis]MYL52283.1 hypothetical protein [Pontibacillus yanchengensis]
MKRRLLLFNVLFVMLLLAVACNQQQEIDISKSVRKTEDYLRQLDEISTTAGSYTEDEEQVKFRLLVEKHPSQEEATAMFNNILNILEKNSHNREFWDNYNGYFDIKSHKTGVIYKATKIIGKDLKVTPK